MITYVGIGLILLSPPDNLQAVGDYRFTWETALTLMTLISGFFLIGLAAGLGLKKQRDQVIK